MREDYAMAIVLTLFCKEVSEPFCLFAAECSGSGVKADIEVLSARECYLEPEYRRTDLLFEICPAFEV